MHIIEMTVRVSRIFPYKNYAVWLRNKKMAAIFVTNFWKMQIANILVKLVNRLKQMH